MSKLKKNVIKHLNLLIKRYPELAGIEKALRALICFLKNAVERAENFSLQEMAVLLQTQNTSLES